MKLTKEEQLAIDLLHKAARHWPNSLWLFSGSGTLNVMKKNENNLQARTETGGVDPNFIVDDIDIENDGGDF